jgi:CarD family transcriptional regulator
MAFNVGDTVVYPHHGAAVIESVEMRKIKGEDREYLVLRVAQGDLTVRVPADNVDLVGVRDVVNAEGLDKVFSVLRQPYTEEPTNWSRRYKANLEKLASGDVIKVAEVVRDLFRREQERGLSAGEKRMLAKARQILVSELALAEKTDEGKAEAIRRPPGGSPRWSRQPAAGNGSGPVPPRPFVNSPARRCSSTR